MWMVSSTELLPTTALRNVTSNSMSVSSSVPLRVLKAGLSIFIVYHLLTIFILPMGSGLLIRELGRYFIGYANHAGINTTWQFFSPGPSSVFYLEYTYTYPSVNPSGDRSSDDVMPDESEAQFIPEKRDGRMISDYYIRRLASLQYLAINPARTEQFLVPWLCAKDKRAESITVRQIFGELQNVERHRGRFGADSFSEMSDTRSTASTTYSCAARTE